MKANAYQRWQLHDKYTREQRAGEGSSSSIHDRRPRREGQRWMNPDSVHGLVSHRATLSHENQAR